MTPLRSAAARRARLAGAGLALAAVFAGGVGVPDASADTQPSAPATVAGVPADASAAGVSADEATAGVRADATAAGVPADAEGVAQVAASQIAGAVGTDASRTTDEDEALTKEQVAAQVEQARKLRAALKKSDAELAAATARLEALSARATIALERVRRAREQQAAAKAEVLRQLERLTALQGQVETQEEDLARWAREAYTTGGPMASYQSWITALRSQTTGEVGHDLAVLEHVGVLGGMNLDRLEVVTAAQKQAASGAAAAARRAVSAKAAADKAKIEADALLKRQRVALKELKKEQERTFGDLSEARKELLRTGTDAALVAEAELAVELKARAVRAAAAAASTVDPTAAALNIDPKGCKGTDTSLYPNGEIPASALCPVWGARGHLLRADAAAGFRELSREYALRFGAPICVTDSYRSRAGQVAVFAAKPNLAAVPGTSNHGLGTALDLCGGIESFGTQEHAWLKAQAPMHGWFHPAWAGPDGSRPEPWHWEFAG